MPDDLYGPDGEVISAETLQAELAQQAQQQADETRREWQSIGERLDGATKAELMALARGGIGEPEC